MRVFWRAIAGVCLSVLVLGALAFGYRAWRQNENARSLAIASPPGVAEGRFVRIGDLDQWIQIRGENRANPVVLFLHGGPGATMIPFFYQSDRARERDFTVVHWDQRGAGRTRIRNAGWGPQPLTIDTFVTDGVAVAEYLRAHLHKQRIIIIGYSNGTLVGTEMARRRPDLFYAYVGTAQMVDEALGARVEYQRLMSLARAANASADIAALERIGPPPYANKQEMVDENQILMRHPPASERNMMPNWGASLAFAPGYSVRDGLDIALNPYSHPEALLREIGEYRAAASGVRFDIPMFYFQGDEDINTPTELVVPYVVSLEAPHKELVLVQGAGHNAIVVENARFLAFMRARVRPLAR